MSLGRVLLDTAVFVYAIGSEHRYREPCQLLLDPDRGADLKPEASVQAIQELLHQRARRTGDRVGAVQTAESMMLLCQLHDLTERDLRLGLQLLRAAPRLHGRDALHAATALNRGIDIIVSPDGAFDTIQGLRRLDPIDAAFLL